MKRLLQTTVYTAALLTGSAFAQAPDKTYFDLKPIKSILQCLSVDGSTAPDARVYVKRGNLADDLLIDVTGLKPGLQFDLFTIQRSPLDQDGSPISSFPGFGLAWYQTDLEADQDGHARAVLHTILLDQIFGLDTDKKEDGTPIIPPTNTFHVGFWFNNPEDAAPCGFDTTKPTPFNGEHKAGPLAMVSLPSSTPAQIGPLCVSPADDAKTGNQHCNP